VNVLYLAPPATTSNAITAHTFIDEEIRAVRDSGVSCFVVSDTVTTAHEREGVRILGVPRPAPPSDILRTLALAVRNVGWLPRPTASNARALFHALRIEQTAAAAIRNYKIDLVHSHFGWPEGFGGTLATSGTAVPLLGSMRGMDLLQRSDIDYGLRQQELYDAAVRRLVRRADRTIYATEFMRGEGIRTGAPRERTRVVRKGVDLEHFTPPSERAERQRALNLTGPVILAVGNLRPLKGYPYLFQALSRNTDLDWTLVICGEGPDRHSLERLASDMNLGRRVRFAGVVARREINDYFASADIFVHPSLIEAAGNVILEALAAGCAVVTTDSGGPREHVLDGETGFVVKPEDADALSIRLRQLLEQPELRRKMGRAARRDAEERFAYGRMIDDLLAVYREAWSGSLHREPRASSNGVGRFHRDTPGTRETGGSGAMSRYP
jgi:glycosyltransferase involved in cell wall biosynthesis